MVIAIIALLAALLLPALRQAREKAQQIACAGHLRQLGLAAKMYENDWDEYMPTAVRLGSDNNTAGYISWNALPPYLGKPSYNANVASLTGESSVFSCPVQHRETDQVWTYAENNYVRNFSDDGPIRSRLYLTMPDRFPPPRIRITPENLPYYLDGFYNQSQDQFKTWRQYLLPDGSPPSVLAMTLSQPHNRGSNMLFHDGHAERIARQHPLWDPTLVPIANRPGTTQQRRVW